VAWFSTGLSIALLKPFYMPVYKQAATGKQRKGDTTRTSSQGRKLASGGNTNKKGEPEIDESSKTPVKDIHRQKHPKAPRP
jgi:hypothetical protein